MNPPVHPIRTVEVLGLLQRWQELSQAERSALEREDWAGLAQAQEEKSALQSRIGECVPGNLSEPEGLPEPLRRAVQRVREMELESLRVLEGKLDSYRGRMSTLDASSRSLRQLQRAYGSTGAAAWQWYS